MFKEALRAIEVAAKAKNESGWEGQKGKKRSTSKSEPEDSLSFWKETDCVVSSNFD